MKNLIYLIVALFIILACKKNDGHQDLSIINRLPDTLGKPNNTKPIENKINQQYCYISANAKDSIFFILYC